VKRLSPWVAESMEFPAVVLLVRTAEAVVQSPPLEVAEDGAPAVLERPCWPESKEPGGAPALQARVLQVQPRNAMDGPVSLPVRRWRSPRQPELERARPELVRVFRGLELRGLSLRQEAAVTVETAWEDVPGFQALRAPVRQLQQVLPER
jgi:hypothetical protein